MRVFFLFNLALLTSFLTMAQNRVALHSAGTTTIFSGPQPFIDAYNASFDGDTIYLPGGNFSGLTISKQLTIIGAGIYDDSTGATSRTNISSHIFLNTGADKSHIEGLYINGNITFGTNNVIDSVLIRRNFCSSIDISGTSNPILSNGVRIEENILSGGVNALHSSNIKIFNNLLRYVSNISENGWIANNLFYTGNTYPLLSVYSSLIENNYFQIGYGLNGVEYNLFRNNAWDNNQSSDPYNTHLNEYYSISTTAMFLNFGISSAFQISDYHLNDPVTYLGFDGSQIGIYGGHNPAKEGWVPFNPHIRTITVAPQTDPSGQLNIQLKVGAQDN